MGRHQTVISKTLYNRAKSELSQLSNINSREGIRLKALISAKENGITLVAKIFKISPLTIRRWAMRLAEDGLKGLKYKSGRGRKCNVPEAKQQLIKNWAEQDNSVTLKEIVIKLKELFGITTSIPAVYRILTKLDFSYITPRPMHHKQNKKDQNDFKK